jgi:hypothetical protein
VNIVELATVAGTLGQSVNGDGVELRLTGIDAREHLVEFELDLAEAGCADCVLPPPALHEMVTSALQRQAPGDYVVVVRDPRTGGPNLEDRAAPSDTVVILSPAAAVLGGDDSPGPDAGPLAGRTVGFRVDRLWRSWDWIVDEWSKALADAGAAAVLWRRFQGLDGAAGAAARAEYATFLDSVDVAVVGLGNCGSCTSWTIKDAITALESGRPTAALTTAHFEQLGQTLATQYGHPALRILALPYPLDSRLEDEVRLIAREWFPAVLETLGAVLV